MYSRLTKVTTPDEERSFRDVPELDQLHTVDKPGFTPPPPPLPGASWVAQQVKNPPAKQETPVQSPGWEVSVEKGWDTHASILRLP